MTHWLRIADGQGEVSTLNPQLFNGATIQFIGALTMGYLFRYDSENRLVPELASVLPTKADGGISPDGRTITFRLRRGVRWSDGAPFTAADVVFSVKAVLNPANNEVSRSGFDLIDRVEALDAYTVRIHLVRPFALFEPVFFGSGGSSPCILPAHLLAKLANINDAPYDKKPIGIGPFRVTRWGRGQPLELEANPYYWRGKPKLQRVTFLFLPSRDRLLEAMQTHDVDLWPGAPPYYLDRITSMSALRSSVEPAGYWSGIFFDTSRKPLDDRHVRTALRLAVDRPHIVADLLHGNGILQEGLLSPITPGVPVSIPLVSYDPALAAKTLDAAGYRAGSDGLRARNGQPLKLTLAYAAGISMNEQIAEQMRDEFKKLGIVLETRQYPASRMFASFGSYGVMTRGDWDMALFAWDSDPNGSLESLFACGSAPPNGLNIMHYCNPKVDEWMHSFTMSFDPSVRLALLTWSEQQIVHDVPAFSLFVWKLGYTYSPQLQGYRPSARAPLGDPLQLDI